MSTISNHCPFRFAPWWILVAVLVCVDSFGFPTLAKPDTWRPAVIRKAHAQDLPCNAAPLPTCARIFAKDERRDELQTNTVKDSLYACKCEIESMLMQLKRDEQFPNDSPASDTYQDLVLPLKRAWDPVKDASFASCMEDFCASCDSTETKEGTSEKGKPEDPTCEHCNPRNQTWIEDHCRRRATSESRALYILALVLIVSIPVVLIIATYRRLQTRLSRARHRSQNDRRSRITARPYLDGTDDARSDSSVDIPEPRNRGNVSNVGDCLRSDDLGCVTSEPRTIESYKMVRIGGLRNPNLSNPQYKAQSGSQFSGARDFPASRIRVMPPATTSRIRSSSYSRPTDYSSGQQLSRRRLSRDYDTHLLDRSSPIFDENLQKELEQQADYLGNPYNNSQGWGTEVLAKGDASGDTDVERYYQRETRNLRSTDGQTLQSVVTAPEMQEPRADAPTRNHSGDLELSDDEDFSTRLQRVL